MKDGGYGPICGIEVVAVSLRRDRDAVWSHRLHATDNISMNYTVVHIV